MNTPERAPGDFVDPRLGQTVAERYRLEARLGEGGMGIVYRAVDSQGGAKVALKLLPSEVASVPELKKRFKREVQVAGRIDHANVARHLDSGRLPDGALYLVMELVEGRSLSSVIAGGRLTLPRALSIARQILSGLRRAHDLGIVHRDVKPDNVMLVADDKVKLLDFGIAADDDATEKLTATGMTFGTPEYISPEMASGDRADGRADLYAVGVILFEMATGRRPFDDKDTIALLQAHVSRRPPSPREVAPDANLPVALVGFLQRALEKRPADRFPTALAMIEALDAVAKAPKPTPREQWAVPREPPARRPEGIASNTSAVRRILAPVPLARDLRLWAAGALLLVVPLALWWTFRTRPADELALPPPRQEVEQLPLPALEHGTCLQRRAVLARVVEGGNRALLPQLRALRDRHRADSCMGPPLRDAVQRLERR